MFSSKKLFFSSQDESPENSEPGTLWAWGSDSAFRIIGDGSKETYDSPIPIGGRYASRFGNHKWISVSNGIGHVLAIREDKTLWGWGRNYSGQLGDGTQTERFNPVQIGGVNSRWNDVSTNEHHTLAIKEDGTLWSWGENQYGVLGDGGIANYRNNPYKIGNDTWKKVKAGRFHSVAIKNDNTLWAWGQAISAGDGIAPPDGVFDRTTPRQIASGIWLDISVGGRDVHSSALRSDGTLWTWGGSNPFGELGCCQGFYPGWPCAGLGIDTQEFINCECENCRYSDGYVVDYKPVQVSGSWSQASASETNVLAIKNDGTLWGWGSGNPKLCEGWSVNTSWRWPKSIYSPSTPPETTWLKISCGLEHCAGIRSNGTLWTWGMNTKGQLGSPGSSAPFDQEMVQIGNTTWSDVFCFRNMTFAIR